MSERQVPTCRATLRALGLDPELVRLVQRPGARFPGLLVIDADDEPVRFIPKRWFTKLCADEGFQAEWQALLLGEEAEAAALESQKPDDFLPPKREERPCPPACAICAEDEAHDEAMH